MIQNNGHLKDDVKYIFLPSAEDLRAASMISST
jgi:hypothetical protein